MSNDRLFLYCNACNKRILLYKYYPGGGSYMPRHIGEIDEFLDVHTHECNNFNPDLHPYLFSVGNERLMTIRELAVKKSLDDTSSHD